MQFGFKVLFYLSVQTQFTEHFIFSSKWPAVYFCVLLFMYKMSNLTGRPPKHPLKSVLNFLSASSGQVGSLNEKMSDVYSGMVLSPH